MPYLNQLIRRHIDKLIKFGVIPIDPIRNGSLPSPKSSYIRSLCFLAVRHNKQQATRTTIKIRQTPLTLQNAICKGSLGSHLKQGHLYLQL